MKKAITVNPVIARTILYSFNFYIYRINPDQSLSVITFGSGVMLVQFYTFDEIDTEAISFNWVDPNPESDI